VGLLSVVDALLWVVDWVVAYGLVVLLSVVGAVVFLLSVVD